jgi:hypothetical protein
MQEKEAGKQMLPEATGATSSNLITFDEENYSNDIENKLKSLNLNKTSTPLDRNTDNCVNASNRSNTGRIESSARTEEEEYKERLRKEQEDFRLAKYLQSQEEVYFAKFDF